MNNEQLLKKVRKVKYLDNKISVDIDAPRLAIPLNDVVEALKKYKSATFIAANECGINSIIKVGKVCAYCKKEFKYDLKNNLIYRIEGYNGFIFYHMDCWFKECFGVLPKEKECKK